MSCLLALDLSTPQGHLAVVRGDEVIYQERFVSHRSHNSMLYAPLAQALKAAGSKLEKIIIGTGPGSYTGVRISIAAAQGVGLSRGIPVAGLPSLMALSTAEEYLTVGDARRGRYYAAHIRGHTFAEGVTLHDEASLRAWLSHRSHLPCLSSDATVPLGLEHVQTALPDAVLLAHRSADHREDESLELEPLYVQEAFITKAKTPTMGDRTATTP